MTDSNIENFFDDVSEGAGVPTAHLSQVNDYVHGQIVSMSQRDYYKMGADEPDKNRDGSIRQQLVIVLQTDERNWANVSRVPKVDYDDPNSAEKPPSEDDGKRAVYCPKGTNIQAAVGKAVQASKSKIAVGGTLGVKVFNLKPTGKPNPLKEHQAVYTPPSAGDAFFGGEQAAPAPQQAAPATGPTPLPQQQAPAPAPQQAAPATGPTPLPQQQAPAPAQQDPWATPAATSGGNPPPF